MRVFIQFDVQLHSPLQALVQARRAVDMFILLESEAPRPIPGQSDEDWRSACPIAGRCMTPKAHPLHPSIFTLLLQKVGNFWLVVATSDIRCTSGRRCSVLLRSCYGSRQVVELDARQQIYCAPLRGASGSWIYRLKGKKKQRLTFLFGGGNKGWRLVWFLSFEGGIVQYKALMLNFCCWWWPWNKVYINSI